MHNSMNKSNYIFQHLAWSIIVFLWFETFFYKCLDGHTYFESVWILSFSSMFIMTIEILCTWKRRRNKYSLFANIILAWGSPCIWIYKDVFKNQIRTIFLIVTVLSCSLSIVILCRRIKRKNKWKSIVKNRVENIFDMWKWNIVCALLYLLIPTALSLWFTGTVINSSENLVKEYENEWTIDNQIETVSNIASGKWKNLTIQQKLNVGQVIVNIEAQRYGISRPILLGTDKLTEGTRAYYDRNKQQIVIDLEYLKSDYPHNIVQTLVHEVTHLYENELVSLFNNLNEADRKLLIFQDVVQYAEELQNYQNGKDSYSDYYNQLVEITSRQAGVERVDVYLKKVNEYLYGSHTTICGSQ